MATVPCPVCHVATTPSGRVHICGFCGHRYRPHEGDPLEFHDKTYRTTHQRQKGEIDETGVTETFHKQRALIVARRVARIKKYLKPTDTVLDAGGGAGTFAAAIRGLVASVTVSEVNHQLLDACRELGLPTVESSIQNMPTDPVYDVVFAWHSLEHCEPLGPAADRLKALFRKYLIIEIPKERGAPPQFDGHYQFFSDESLQLLFSDLVIRQYGDGVQAPARLVVFEKRRQVKALEKRAASPPKKRPAAS